MPVCLLLQPEYRRRRRFVKGGTEAPASLARHRARTIMIPMPLSADICWQQKRTALEADAEACETVRTVAVGCAVGKLHR